LRLIKNKLDFGGKEGDRLTFFRWNFEHFSMGVGEGGIKRKRFACAISWNETTAMEKKLQVAPLPLRDFPLHENENEF
jgi:hypothetical protein